MDGVRNVIEIRLSRGIWEYDPLSPLGPRGGFGQVFVGRGTQHSSVAVKQLDIGIGDAAHRELDIANDLISRPLQHVIPILDFGIGVPSGSCFVVMPRAERSLRQYLADEGLIDEGEAIDILLDIAYGLREVSHLVHRDLKPANVLFHEGRWKLADFGIARLVERSTSPRTLRDCLTAAYAAPEQWRLERVTTATDIYALGCICYALTTGSPPFPGPQRADYRHQHLNQSPPPLASVSPTVRSLVLMMLAKAQLARPSLDRVIQLLQGVGPSAKEGGGAGSAALARVGAELAERALTADAERAELETKQQGRRELAAAAFQVLRECTDELGERVCHVAPVARLLSVSANDLLRIRLGTAEINVTAVNAGRPFADDALPRSGVDIVAGARIEVIQADPKRYQWSASLFYTNRDDDQGYRWWEYAFMVNALVPAGPRNQPFAIQDISVLDQVFSPGMGQYQLAAAPKPVDGEDIDGFCRRWMDLLALAAGGRLEAPRNLPLP